MPQDDHKALQQIIEFCAEQWIEADKAPNETTDMKTGKKMAYNSVLQHARKLLASPSSES